MQSLAHLQKGSLYLPLLFLLSLSGLFLVKTVAVRSFEGYQQEVTSNFDRHYDINSTQYALSSFIGSPETWKEFTNSDYGFRLKYPSSWTIAQNFQSDPGVLNSSQIIFANKVNLTVNVKKNSDIQNSWQKIKIIDNEFYLNQKEINTFVAQLKHKNLYYEIFLSHNNFFANGQDLRNTFILILKNFQFTN